MVSPEMMRQLATAFDELKNRSFNVNDYKGAAFDVAFDIVTLETGIAGIADRVLSGQPVPKDLLQILRRSFIADGRSFVNHNGHSFDLSDTPDLLKYIKLIDRVRKLCLQIVQEGQ